VQAGTVIGTSLQLMRARAIRLIEKHWGADWLLEIPANMKDPAWSIAADCSHRLLRLIAANAKQGIDLETAKSAWAQSIRRRKDERVRKELRMHCPRFPFIITDDGDGWRVTNDGRSKQKRNGNQIILVPLADCDGSHLRTELLSAESRAGPPHVADGVVRSSVRPVDQVLCDGPNIAADLRRIIGTLALSGKDGSASIKLAGCCCTPCRSRIDILDEMINGAIQVATALEELTDHQISSGDLQYSDSVPSTSQLPRQYRWWLPIDGETDDE
jgi:hypothetical protein